jgi:hypothetical protein
MMHFNGVSMSQDFEKPNEFWKLCESYTLLEATLLILNIEPEGNENIERKSNKPKGLTAILASLNSAIKNGTLDADEQTPSAQTILAGNKQYLTINANNLKDWLKTKNFTTGFLFDNKDLPIRTPDYLNKDHPNYAYKLAAAVRAWEAVSTDEKYKNNGKSPKTNLINYLNTHAAELELIKDNGEPNIKAIEHQISVVTNWAIKGGVAETPNL